MHTAWLHKTSLLFTPIQLPAGKPGVGIDSCRSSKAQKTSAKIRYKKTDAVTGGFYETT